MKKESKYRPYISRLVVVFLLSLVFVVAFNEIVYLIQKEDTDRGPKTVQLVIQMGTYDRINAGETETTIPEDMVFVLGDVLEVKNEDIISHQLGPVWVPPGATSKLVMEKASKYSYNCSFQPGQFLGLDVRQPTTLATRITGISMVTPTMTALVFVYSLLIFPVKPKDASKKGEA